jgi:hypothetical protein
VFPVKKEESRRTKSRVFRFEFASLNSGLDRIARRNPAHGVGRQCGSHANRKSDDRDTAAGFFNSKFASANA